MTTTRDGVLVGLEPSPDPDAEQSGIVAYENGSMKWAASIRGDCTFDKRISIYHVVTGADNNIYGLAHNSLASWNAGCGRGGYFFGISSNDGKLLFNKSVGPDLMNFIGAYKYGIVVEVSESSLRYFDYNGDSLGTVDTGIQAPLHAQSHAVNPDGYVYVNVVSDSLSNPDCEHLASVNRIDIFTVAGRTGTYEVPTVCGTPIFSFSAASWGAPLIVQDRNSDVLFVTLDVRGNALATRTFPAREGDRVYGEGFFGTQYAVWPESHGRVVMVRQFLYDNLTSRSTQVQIIDPNSAATISALDTSGLDGGQSRTLLGSASAEGMVYVAELSCGGDPRCANPVRTMFGISIPTIGMDEPRSTLFEGGQLSLKYVALGDSYSSGEGAPGPGPDYLPGTDVEGNRCHRSKAAYSNLVHAETRSIYQFFVLRACSGATIQDFYKSNQEGNAPEPPQLSWLKGNTGLVTLTIGGIDVGFNKVMRYCATRRSRDPSCKEKFQSMANAAIARISSTNSKQKNTLPSVYRAVRLTVGSAKVLVLGYPRLFPKSPPKKCATGVPFRSFERSDMVWLNDEGKKLDTVIRRAAKRAGLTYVDTYAAFNGHELCTVKPYVNRAIALPTSKQVWSFHPNVAGHTRLAQIVERHL